MHFANYKYQVWMAFFVLRKFCQAIPNFKASSPCLRTEQIFVERQVRFYNLQVLKWLKISIMEIWSRFQSLYSQQKPALVVIKKKK